MTALRTLALSILLLAACGADEASAPSARGPDEAPAADQTPAADEPTPAAETPIAETPRSRAYANPTEGIGTLPDGVGVAVGQRAPDAQVHTFDGDEISLASLWSDGAVLLVFYRGGWCPYCNYQVHELAEANARFADRGITPVVISVDRPEEGARTRASWEIPFPVLSDQDLAAHRAFRVVNEVDDETFERLQGMGMDLAAHAGRDHHTIAVPAIFLIDAEGTVRWAHAELDYRTRPSPAQILDALPAP